MGFLSFLGGVERQINPFDSGKTFKDSQGSGDKSSTATQVKNLGAGIVKGAVAPFQYLARTNIINPIKSVNAVARGDKQAFNNAEAAYQRPIGQQLREFAGNTAQIGLDFLAPGIADAASNVATGVIGAAAPNLAGEAVGRAAIGLPAISEGLNTGIKALTGPLAGAAIGAPFNVANTVAGTEPLTKENLLKSATYGAAGGALFGAGGEALGLAKDNIHPLGQSGALPIGNLLPKDIEDLAAANSPTQVKAILKDKVDPATADTVAKSISLTNNPSTIQDIIDKHSPAPSPTTPETTTTPVTEDTTAQQGSEQTPNTQRQFIDTVKNSPNVSPEVKAAVSSPLVTRADATLVNNTQQFMNQDLDKATEQAHQILTKPLGSITDQETSNVIAAAQAHDALGTDAGHQQATDIYEKLAPQRTETARALRAGQILNSRTPDGLKYQAIKDLGKAGIKVEGDLQGKLNDAIEKVRAADPNSDDHALAVQEVQKIVKGAIPSTAGDKAFALWRTGLLTGPQTVGKIITSHAGQGIFSIAKDYPSAIIDKITSGFTGQRAVAAPGAAELGQYGKGFATGFGDMKGYIQTGLEKDPITGNALELRNTTNFQHQLFQNYTDWVGRVHGSIYKPFNTGETFRSLFNQATVDAKNLGLKGEEASAHIAEFMKEPPKEAADAAVHEGQVATFQQETALGKAATQIQKLPVIGKIVAPFTKIPSAIATDLINASPVGAVRTILDGIKAAKSSEGWTVEAQRKFSQGLGTSITGTAIMIPGIALFRKGLITLGYPQDPKEQKLWAEEGKQPNSILIGGKWRSLGSIGPSGSALEIGGHIAKSLSQGNSLEQAVTDGFVGGAQSIEEQSYLRGISGAINALNDPGRYAGNFVKQTAGSIVPTAVSTVAAAGDKYQRQTNSPLDAIKSRIPGARESLAPKVDTFGNPLPNQNPGIQRLFDPFQSSTALPSTPLVSTLRSLQDAGYGITPATIGKNEVFDKIKTPLTAEQRTELTTEIGQETQKIWTQMVTQPGFKDLSPDVQKQTLQSIYSLIVNVKKSQFAAKNKFGAYSKDYSTKLHQPKKG